MIRILTIVGARPQFIKAAMISRAIVEHNRRGENPTVVEEIIHTGQHYDANMSDIFFQQMQIPEPVVNLQAGTGMHGEMTGRMLAQIEKEIVNRNPEWVLVYGDTNSTLAGALAAAKLHVPVAHVEAGLRSFNKCMPEEINRILTDHVSSLLFCPTQAAVDSLSREGITRGVHHVGDVMYDAAQIFVKIAGHTSTILRDLNLTPGEYYLATVHRAENTDDPDRLRNILTALNALEGPVILPLHPRTRKILQGFFPSLLTPHSSQGTPHSSLHIVDPVSFLDMVELEKNARTILTDSGGVQKEAYFHGVPCVTLREETEWVETVQAGWNQVVGADPEKIVVAVRRGLTGKSIAEYGQGNASADVLKLICSATASL
ncbi:MAG: UDP-2,3-diacetamido-2,3-dideoxy-D-glucuronate 2-epimerase [Syntrophorhabdus sp. PtaU1.Bin153]|nr:MAG: UDP-2,3-diacetamido-2,3-dideoxy-D-glucuronate 2-epimerase [Syntrophorhabdus sp. PtaU1.Bin153]